MEPVPVISCNQARISAEELGHQQSIISYQETSEAENYNRPIFTESTNLNMSSNFFYQTGGVSEMAKQITIHVVFVQRGCDSALQEVVYDSNQHPVYCMLSFLAIIYGSRNYGMEIGTVPLSITSSDPGNNAYCCHDFMVCCPRNVVLVARVLLPRDTTNISSNQNLESHHGQFEISMSLCEQATIGLTIVGYVIGPHY